MGTRNLVCVVKGGEYKVAQYGQWDGYPTGQGETIVEFLLQRMDRAMFERHLDNTTVMTREEITAFWKKAGADDNGSIACSKADDAEKDAPHMSRNTGAKILDYVQRTPYPKLQHELDFAGDSLFCEWAYVVDLDTDTLEVYKGFNKTGVPVGERFEKMPCEKPHRKDGDQ